MEYSEVLKQTLLRPKHYFLYGEAKERIKYLENLANQYQYDINNPQPMLIYTDYKGLPDCENPLCEQWQVGALQKYHFEIVLLSLIFKKIRRNVPKKEQEDLEKVLPELFGNEKMKSLEIVGNILKNTQVIYEEAYKYFIENAEIKVGLFEKIEYEEVILDFFLPDLKKYLPPVTDFTFLINKTGTFGRTYTSVINTYIASREHNCINIKVGCNDLRDWANYYSVNGEVIQDTHDYSCRTLEDWSLNKIKRK